jgi:hypothetical protein
MTATQRLLQVILTTAILFVGIAAAADDSATVDRVKSITASIEKAFSRNDARELRPVLPRRGKIRVASRTLEIDEGYYGREQIVIVFQRLFEARKTLSFSFQPRDPRHGRDRRIQLTALWRYRPPTAASSQIRLEFTLAPLDEAWWVREIRELD